MFSLLLHSATALEIAPCLDFLQPYRKSDNLFEYGNCRIHVCISGVGMTKTAFALGKISDLQPDLAINAGICGAFRKYRPGDVLQVREDLFAELGAEDDEGFLSIDQLGLGEQRVSVMNPFHTAQIDSLPLARGITVNKVHGHWPSINSTVSRYNCDCESMEGAAFIFAANENGWKALQLRAVSNMVEKRDRGSWQIGLAVNNLNQVLTALLSELQNTKRP